ncbi:MAG: ATPase, partial [Duncaniella sp.]|nr:ATPase [Duncaniella sp.]
GIALLAAYTVSGAAAGTLPGWLDDCVFAGAAGSEIAPDPDDVAGFANYLRRYKACLPVEQAAVDCL